MGGVDKMKRFGSFILFLVLGYIYLGVVGDFLGTSKGLTSVRINFYVVVFSLVCFIFGLYYIQIKQYIYFRKSLIEKIDYDENEDVLKVKIKGGSIEIPKGDLEKFLVVVKKNYYIFLVPFFDWSIKIPSDKIPFQLTKKKAKDKENPIAKISVLKNAKYLSADSRKLFMKAFVPQLLIFVVTILLLFLVKGFVAVWWDVAGVLVISLIICRALLMAVMMNGKVGRKRGLDIPREFGEKYLYKIEGTKVFLDSSVIHFAYNSKTSTVITYYEIYSYFRVISRYDYKKLKSNNLI